MAAETLVPTAIEAISGLTGSVGDVDNTIAASDGVWLDAPGDPAVDVQVRCEFATPTGNPTTGAGLQRFRIRCRRSDTGGNDPTLDVSLYENNVLNTLLSAAIPITSDAGQTVEVTWDASLLNNADGSAVELHLYGNRSGGGPSLRRTVEFDEMEWVVEYSVGGEPAHSAGMIPIL